MANRIFKTYSFLDDEFRKLVFEQEFANENNETVIIKKDDAVKNLKKEEEKNNEKI